MRHLGDNIVDRVEIASGVELLGSEVGLIEYISGMFDGGELEAEAEPQIGLFVFSRKFEGLDDRIVASGSEAPGDQHSLGGFDELPTVALVVQDR